MSFKTKENLPVLELEKEDLQKGDKIVAIGHPNGDKYKKSYGIITSNIKTRSIKNKSNGKK